MGNDFFIIIGALGYMDGILVLCMTNPKTPKGKCAELEGIHQ
jgi:hypothetical protein